jgi:hypothetical protein
VHELDEAEELIELNQKAFAVKKSQAQVAAELLKAAKIAVKKPKPVKTKAVKKTKAQLAAELLKAAKKKTAAPKSNLPVDGSKNTWKAFVDPVPKAALNPKRTFLPKTAKAFQLPGKVSKKNPWGRDRGEERVEAALTSAEQVNKPSKFMAKIQKEEKKPDHNLPLTSLKTGVAPGQMGEGNKKKKKLTKKEKQEKLAWPLGRPVPTLFLDESYGASDAYDPVQDMLRANGLDSMPSATSLDSHRSHSSPNMAQPKPMAHHEKRQLGESNKNRHQRKADHSAFADVKAEEAVKPVKLHKKKKRKMKKTKKKQVTLGEGDEGEEGDEDEDDSQGDLGESENVKAFVPHDNEGELPEASITASAQSAQDHPAQAVQQSTETEASDDDVEDTTHIDDGVDSP